MKARTSSKMLSGDKVAGKLIEGFDYVVRDLGNGFVIEHLTEKSINAGKKFRNYLMSDQFTNDYNYLLGLPSINSKAS